MNSIEIKRSAKWLPVVLFLLMSCTRSNDKEGIRIIKSVSYELNTTKDVGILSSKGLSQLDSVFFSDGTIAICQVGYAPSNTLTELKDPYGQLLATISSASEAQGQVWVHNHDSLGRLTNLLLFYYTDLDEYDKERYKEWFGDGLESFRNMQDLFDYANPDTSKYMQINIEYDTDGDAVRTYMVHKTSKIEAPEGYKLVVSQDKCPNFWASDIDGAQYVYTVDMMPKDTSREEYTRFRYYDFKPVIEENYENGQIVRAVLYPSGNEYGGSKITVSMKVEGNTHVYTTRIAGDRNINCRYWEKGLLVKEQEISPYGTVYRESIYSYSLPSTLVKRVDYKINFKNKNTLEFEKSSELTLSSMGQEHDEMKLLKIYPDYWCDYYNGDEY